MLYGHFKRLEERAIAKDKCIFRLLGYTVNLGAMTDPGKRPTTTK